MRVMNRYIGYELLQACKGLHRTDWMAVELATATDEDSCELCTKVINGQVRRL